jgi:hypothetical protein
MLVFWRAGAVAGVQVHPLLVASCVTAAAAAIAAAVATATNSAADCWRAATAARADAARAGRVTAAVCCVGSRSDMPSVQEGVTKDMHLAKASNQQ